MRPPVAQTGVLLTRLLPPRLPPDCLERPALVELVVEGTRWRLVTVLAGAGYGKTTLIAQALGHVEPKLVWASCDERLGGSADLLAHMAAGIEQSVPGFGAQLAVEGTVERQVMALCNEIVATPADEHSTQQRRTG